MTIYTITRYRDTTRTPVVRKNTISWRHAAHAFDLTPVFSNDLGCWTSLLIFGWFSRMLVFEKLVALFARKSNENLGLLRRAMKVGYARVSTRDQHHRAPQESEILVGLSGEKRNQF